MLYSILSTFLLFHKLLTPAVASPTLSLLSSNSDLSLQPNLELNVTIPGALNPG